MVERRVVNLQQAAIAQNLQLEQFSDLRKVCQLLGDRVDESANQLVQRDKSTGTYHGFLVKNNKLNTFP